MRLTPYGEDNSAESNRQVMPAQVMCEGRSLQVFPAANHQSSKLKPQTLWSKDKPSLTKIRTRRSVSIVKTAAVSHH